MSSAENKPPHRVASNIEKITTSVAISKLFSHVLFLYTDFILVNVAGADILPIIINL
jgi:hypothetical protein